MKCIVVNDIKWETLPPEENEHTVPFGGFVNDKTFNWSQLNGKMTDIIIILKED